MPVKYVVLTASAALMLVLSGCASHHVFEQPERLQRFSAPAFSLSLPQTEMTVAVSPIRQTMQIGGTMTAVLGAGISALQDGHYARRVHQALKDYDCSVVLESAVAPALEEAFQSSPARVIPVGSSAGFHSIQEARRARLDGLRKRGYDVVLDLESAYGIYGAEGLLAVRVKGELIDLSSHKRLWRNTMTAYTLDLFAGRKWKDPMERLTPNLMSPRFVSDKDAIDQWTEDDGASLRAAFESATAQLVEALLCDLGVRESKDGLALLGTNAYLEGDKERALHYFSRARALAPADPVIANGLALALAGSDRMEEAVAAAQEALEASPDDLPLNYNLAWWYGLKMKQADAGRAFYDKALALGAHPARRLKRAYDN